MLSHWSVSDNKSPLISRTLLSILADLNYAVVWMVSTRPLISKSSIPFINPSVNVPRAPVTISIIVTFMFHSFYNSLARSMYLSLFSHSFSFTLWSTGTTKSTILQVLFFFVDYYKLWSSGRDLVIRLYLKIPEESVRPILYDRFWVVHIPFVHIVKIQLLALFLTHSVVPSFIIFLC